MAVKDTGVHNSRGTKGRLIMVQPMWDFNIYEELYFNDQHYLRELPGFKKNAHGLKGVSINQKCSS